MTRKLVALFLAVLDDLLLLLGCACILYGISMVSTVATWITGGIMLIGISVLVGKAKHNAAG